MNKVTFSIYLFVSLLFFTCSNAFGETYFNFLYHVHENESFSSILKKFVKEDSFISAETSMVVKIKKLNGHIKNWDILSAGVTIELYIDVRFMNLAQYRIYQQKNVQIIKKIFAETPNVNLNGFKGSFFYMASLGLFTQESSTVDKITFKQNSPMTVGVSLNFFSAKSPFSTSFSSYYSLLMGSTSNLGNSSNVSIPAEVGINLFEEYRPAGSNATFYLGPDFERFSIFNLDGLQQRQQVYSDSVSITYLTLGLSRKISLFSKEFFTKFSLSHGLMSSTKKGIPADVILNEENKKYGGYKVMLYLNYKLSAKTYFHSLLKYHAIDGPSKVSTLRIGVGFGYIFF
ncbi:MAG: hypothetical protein KBD76_12200 [Bacteriovorax sp.]|jgi:hypothetical protein|nr:hypothetical protein [Bacteriovorax sp.]